MVMLDLQGKKGLIIKLRYIGDTLSILPVIQNVKGKVPGVTIDVMVNRGTEEALIHHPDIRFVWAYDRDKATNSIKENIGYHKNLIKKLRFEKYDFVIDFTLGDRAAFLSFMTGAPIRMTYHHASTLSRILMNYIIRSNPSKQHIVDLQLLSLRAFGLNHFNRFYQIPIPSSINERVDQFFSHANINDHAFLAFIHPGARGKLRRWPPERFSEIARRLKGKHNAQIILIGGPEETEVIQQVERRMGFVAAIKSTELSLLEMAAILSRCRLFIGNDSAPGHIAAGVGCPSVTLFGPTFPHMWRPLSRWGEVVFKHVPCCGCRQETCIRPENHCMDLIQVDEVWEKIEALLIASHLK